MKKKKNKKPTKPSSKYNKTQLDIIINTQKSFTETVFKAINSN